MMHGDLGPSSAKRSGRHGARAPWAFGLGAAAWLLALTACSSSRPIAAPRVDPGDDPARTSSVLLADTDLEDYLAVEDTRVERLSDNLLKIHVRIRNVSDTNVPILVETEFFQQGRIPYGDRTPRSVFLVPRGGTISYSATSTQARAADFTVTIWRNKVR